MSLSRKTKKARKIAEKRRNESPDTKNRRREANKMYIRSQRATESQILREIRLNQTKERVAALRKRESFESRVSRLKRMREYSANVRACEDSQSREKRLRTMREYASKMREAESPLSRQLRLAAMRDYASGVRKLKSPQSLLRFMAMRDYPSQTSELESPQLWELSLNNMRHVSRQAYISQRVCKQMIFINQTKQMQKAQCQLLSEDCPEHFVDNGNGSAPEQFLGEDFNLSQRCDDGTIANDSVPEQLAEESNLSQACVEVSEFKIEIKEEVLTYNTNEDYAENINNFEFTSSYDSMPEQVHGESSNSQEYDERNVLRTYIKEEVITHDTNEC